MTKAGQPGLQLGQACGQAPIHGGVERENSLRFAQSWQASPDMHVGQDVAQDEHSVLLAPEREMPGRMTRCFEHPETPNLVTLAEPRDTGCDGPTQCGPTVAVSQWGGIRAMISPAVSIAGASAAPHHSGSPSSSQIAWLAP